MIALLIGTLLVLLFLTVPIFAGLAISTLAVFMAYFPGQMMDMMLAQSMVKSCDSFALMAIPFFMLVGTLMSTSGLAQKLVKVAESVTGDSAGGLGTSAMIASMLFAAISGSGPAFFYKVIEDMARAGEKLGLDYEKSLLLATQTALGSAKMVFNKGELTVQNLIDNVATKGGCTFVGITVMNEENSDKLFYDVIDETAKKAHELGA